SEASLPAGGFSVWIGHMLGALRDEHPADVPCGTCTACCRSSQFVHIAPDELDTLVHVPAELLFPAPGLPRGHVVLGYDDRGHCPMLVDDRCSIYAHRPRTCRTYDCRVFAAAGVDPDDKPLIAERSRHWEFEHEDPAATARHAAVRAAAEFLREHDDVAGAARTSPTRLAVAAVQVHELFGSAVPGSDAVRVELRRWARRD
ncbi:MAG TPA: YkgJ family cysteine cluster protein, partial [Ilumatobacteraceae bacterium]